MKISQAFPSKYLKASDLENKQPRVTISHVQMENIAEGEDAKPVIFFKGKEKGMVLNKTNANTIRMAYGDDTDDWANEDIVLFSAMIDFQGKQTEALRVKIPPRNKKPVETAAAATGDDEVPF